MFDSEGCKYVLIIAKRGKYFLKYTHAQENLTFPYTGQLWSFSAWAIKELNSAENLPDTHGTTL